MSARTHASADKTAADKATDDTTPGEKPALLQTRSRFSVPDDAYRAIVESQRGLSGDAAVRMNARLVLLLANHVGDMDVLREALALAKEGLAKEGLAKEGLAKEGLAKEGLAKEGLAKEGLAKEGLAQSDEAR